MQEEKYWTTDKLTLNTSSLWSRYRIHYIHSNRSTM